MSCDHQQTFPVLGTLQADLGVYHGVTWDSAKQVWAEFLFSELLFIPDKFFCILEKWIKLIRRQSEA